MDFRVDYVVFGYVAGICCLTAILFGLAPALHVSKTNNNVVLKEGGRGTTGNRRARWFSGTMVVTELALTIVLLAGAGLMVRSFMNLERLDAGFSIEHLLTMRLQLPEAKYGNADQRRAFYEQLEPRLTAIAGVDAVAVTTTVPPLRAGERVFEINGRPPAQPNDQLEVAAVTISPRFFEVVGVNLLRGRASRTLTAPLVPRPSSSTSGWPRTTFPGRIHLAGGFGSCHASPLQTSQPYRGAPSSASARRFGTARRGRSN